MNIDFRQFTMPTEGLLVIALPESKQLCAIGKQLDSIMAGAIARSLTTARFSGAFGETVDMACPTGAGPDHILLIGLGNAAAMTLNQWEVIGGKVCAHAQKLSLSSLAFYLSDNADTTVSPEAILSHFALGSLLKSYRFEKYRTVKSFQLERFSLMANLVKPILAELTFKRLKAIADAIFLTRNLVLEPASVMTPMALCSMAEALTQYQVKTQVFSGNQALADDFPATLAVGQGSVETSAVCVMEWRGVNGDKKPVIALAGKGVTFDAGGLTIKSESQQRLMKMDMAGAATIIAVMQAIAMLKLDIGIVAAFGAVENMPGSNAYRSGDVIAMKNQTSVEVTFPDAEGRLVLADLNTYLCRTYRPNYLLDVATLTATVVAALGDGCTGMFSNDDQLASALLQAAEQANEPMWRLPQGKTYLASLDSHIADMKNMPSPNYIGVLAGSASVAASFLEHFTEDCAWAHLDMSGSAWQVAESDLGPDGATGALVRTLIYWLESMVNK